MRVVAADALNQYNRHPVYNTKASDATSNIFTTILSSDRPASEKSLDHLQQQGLELISAGSETAARVLAAATYHILATPGVLVNLRTEVDPLFASKDTVTVRDLEALPYLTAVLKESLRIGAVVSTRFPLVAPAQDLVYGEYTIPSGAAVSMTPHRILHDPECYSDPYHFRPERWLGSPEDVKKAERYFLPFSKGGRNCLGVNLAWAELYLVVAHVVHRLEMELYDTVRERDVDVSRDLFMGRPKKESQGIRVTVRERVTEVKAMV